VRKDLLNSKVKRKRNAITSTPNVSATYSATVSSVAALLQ
jgi:hypothetical protein